MTGIILNGCNGRMGRVVYEQSLHITGAEIIAGVDLCHADNLAFPCFESFDAIDDEIINKADAIIDFSNPAALSGLLEFSTTHSIPAIICTTGLNQEQVAQIKLASNSVAMFFSANMSLGVNLLCELAKKAARMLGESFDIEIVEMHHNQKVDAPSGTALMLADAISNELEGDISYEYDRHLKSEKRPKKEIGIHAVRGGTITGEHEIIFAGHDEIIKLSHSARSKELFATGALNAAKYIKGKPAGMYSMEDLMK